MSESNSVGSPPVEDAAPTTPPEPSPSTTERGPLAARRVSVNRDARKQPPELSLEIVEQWRAGADLAVPLFEPNDAPRSASAPRDRAWLNTELRRCQAALHDLESVSDLPPAIVAPALQCLVARAVQAVLIAEGIEYDTTPEQLVVPSREASVQSVVTDHDLALMLRVAGLARKARALDEVVQRADRRHLADCVTAARRMMVRYRRAARPAARVRARRAVPVFAGVAVVGVALLLAVAWLLGRGSGLEPAAPLEKPPGKIGGVRALYYPTRDLTGKAVERFDRSLSFRWPTKPHSVLPADNFSVSWRGYLRMEKRGTYRVCTDSDDGVRLSLGGEKVIDNWTAHAVRQDCQEIRASAPGWYKLELQFYEQHGSATVALHTARKGDPLRLVSSDQLCCLDR